VAPAPSPAEPLAAGDVALQSLSLCTSQVSPAGQSASAWQRNFSGSHSPGDGAILALEQLPELESQAPAVSGRSQP
jgi:hypothetical protein